MGCVERLIKRPESVKNIACQFYGKTNRFFQNYRFQQLFLVFCRLYFEDSIKMHKFTPSSCKVWSFDKDLHLLKQNI